MFFCVFFGMDLQQTTLKVYTVIENLGYVTADSQQGDAQQLTLSYITNSDGSLRWVWPIALNKPSFLKFYNIQGRKAKLFSFVIQLIFLFRLNQWLFKKVDVCITSNGEKPILDLQGQQWALFTGTMGPNQKFLAYVEDPLGNGAFIKIPIHQRSRDLVSNEAKVLKALSRYSISAFSYPQIQDNTESHLALSDGRPFNLRNPLFTSQHAAVLDQMSKIHSQTVLFSDFDQMHKLQQRIMQLEARRVLVPGGILKKIKMLYSSLLHIDLSIHLAHGDFTPWNMYTNSKGELYIYDWELSQSNLPKGFDFFHYFMQKGLLTEKKSWKDIKAEMQLHSSTAYFDEENQQTLFSLYLLINCIYYLEIYEEQKHWHVQVHWLLKAWNEALSDVLSQHHDERELLILDLFDQLQYMPYAGHKIPEENPEKLSVYSDLDIIISKQNAHSLIQEISTHPCIANIKISRYSGITQCTLLTSSQKVLSLDLIHQLKWKNLQYMDTQEMIKCAIVDKYGIKRTNPHHLMTFIGFFYGLNNAEVPYQHQKRFYLNNDENPTLHHVLNYQFLTGEPQQKALKSLISKDKTNKGLAWIFNTWNYGCDTVKSRMMQKGLVITFSGVDGAGKSTIIEHTRKEIEKRLRKKVVVLRHRPSLLPILSAWTKGRSKAEQDAATTLPRQGNNTSYLNSVLRFLYYYTDYLLGQFYVYFKYVWAGDVVLYDRYYYDFICDAKRSNIHLPHWMVRAGFALIITPRLNFFLYAHAETILSRKKELDEATITSLTNDYLKVFNELKKKSKNKFVMIENTSFSKTLEIISQKIQQELL